MNLEESARYDATGLAELLARREVTAAELTRLALDGIDAVNPTLNFVAGPIDPVIEGASDAPFSGVPFAIKDLVLQAEGVAHTMGTRALAGDVYVSDYSSELFRRFSAAGLTTVTRTTTPELGYNANTEAVLYGSTRNPWNIEYSPAGSSGGSGVAVAAGVVPIAHANDGGGSIRLPASSCGVVGLKPSRARTPMGPTYQMSLHGMGVEFAHTRTVRDAATLLDLVAGPEPHSFIPLSNPEQPFASVIGNPYKKLRIAVAPHGLHGTPNPDPAVAELVTTAGRSLDELGHEVVEIGKLPYLHEEFHRANPRFWWSLCASILDGFEANFGVKPSTETFEHVSLVSAEAGRSLSAADMEEAMLIAAQVSVHMGATMADYDAVLLPPSRHGALRLGVLNQNDPDLTAQGYYDQLFDLIPYTAVFNMTGQPAIAVPTGEVNGVPCGIQIVAKMAREDILLSLSAELEQALPWADRRPAVHVADH